FTAALDRAKAVDVADRAGPGARGRGGDGPLEPGEGCDDLAVRGRHFDAAFVAARADVVAAGPAIHLRAGLGGRLEAADGRQVVPGALAVVAAAFERRVVRRDRAEPGAGRFGFDPVCRFAFEYGDAAFRCIRHIGGAGHRVDRDSARFGYVSGPELVELDLV